METTHTPSSRLINLQQILVVKHDATAERNVRSLSTHLDECARNRNRVQKTAWAESRDESAAGGLEVSICMCLYLQKEGSLEE